MLWLALCGKYCGVRWSKLVNIEDETLALDFDLACTRRLLDFENERDNARLEVLIKSLYQLACGLLGVKTDDAQTDAETKAEEW